MSIIARFMEPTGLEFHDVAYKIDAEIWNTDLYFLETIGVWPEHSQRRARR